MRVVMLGAAHVHATGYARVLTRIKGAELAAVYDRDKAYAAAVAVISGAKICASAAECLEGADAVIVCAENALHLEMVTAAARAGVGVLCEKPLAPTVNEARAIADLCRESRVPLQVAFPCRYHPTIDRAKAHLDSGKLGEILAIRGTNHGRMPGGWFTDPALAGGGAVMDHTVHVVDLLRYLLRDEVVEVYAEAATLFHDIPVDDCGMLSMKLASGAFATLDPSWSRPASFPTWGDVTLEFVGTEGTLFVDMFQQNVNVYREGGNPPYTWAPYGTDMNEMMLKDFLQRMQEGREPSITGVDGVRATAVVEAAYASANSGKAEPVTHLSAL